MKPGLERIAPLLQRLGNPQDAFASVHVVGTNGKGSTASFLSAMLSCAGHRTGLFTSPHLISFTERLRIDGAEIGEAAVPPLAERVLAAAPPEATFFEIVTALALLYFAESGVRIAIVEAGMGGRLDATNVVDGILTVVTPVSLDHCDYLGATIAEIAAEKAGIVKPESLVVSARQHPDAAGAIAARAAEVGAELLVEGTDFEGRWDGNVLNYRGLALQLDGLAPGLPGRYQAGNAACALAAAEALSGRGFPVSAADLAAGTEQARWPGRMERFPGSPDIILDGAHNAAGAVALAESLRAVPRGRLLLVVGVMADKELSGILSPLLPLAAQVFAVAPALERALPAAELARYCRAVGFAAEDAGSVADGIARARAAAAPDDLILVAGSLFTVGEARGILISRGVQPFRG
ncbi:folylpolyglutamate synthase/dihydrofolate synthase family protein [Geomesophilobacter sediminis]|nr:folylpolyglutamate synthase/dihydrofolate synthase family protein [Geomesophilobacter sediminis]